MILPLHSHFAFRFLSSSNISCRELNFICLISYTRYKYPIFRHRCRSMNWSRRELISLLTEHLVLSHPSFKNFCRLSWSLSLPFRLWLSLYSDKYAYFNVFYAIVAQLNDIHFDICIFTILSSDMILIEHSYSQLCSLLTFSLSVWLSKNAIQIIQGVTKLMTPPLPSRTADAILISLL
jgi:hypothetical protein